MSSKTKVDFYPVCSGCQSWVRVQDLADGICQPKGIIYNRYHRACKRLYKPKDGGKMHVTIGNPHRCGNSLFVAMFDEVYCKIDGDHCDRRCRCHKQTTSNRKITATKTVTSYEQKCSCMDLIRLAKEDCIASVAKQAQNHIIVSEKCDEKGTNISATLWVIGGDKKP